MEEAAREQGNSSQLAGTIKVFLFNIEAANLERSTLKPPASIVRETAARVPFVRERRLMFLCMEMLGNGISPEFLRILFWFRERAT